MSQSIHLFFTMLLLSQICQPNKLFDERDQTLLAAAYDSLIRKDLITKKSKYVDTNNDSHEGKPDKEFKKRLKTRKSYIYKGKKYAGYFGNQHHQVVNNVTKVLKNDKSYNPAKYTQSHIHKKIHSNNTDTQIPLKNNQEINDVTPEINNYYESSNRVQKRDLYFKSIQPDSENYVEFPVVTDKVDDLQINKLFFFNRDDTIDDIDNDFIEPPIPELSNANIINIIMKDKPTKVSDHGLRFRNRYWNRSKMEAPSTVITYIKNYSLKPKIYHRVSLPPNVTLRKNTSRMLSLLNNSQNRFQLTKLEKTTTNIKDQLTSTLNKHRVANLQNKNSKSNNKPEGSIPVLTDIDQDADKKNLNMKNVLKIDGLDIEANDLYSEESLYFADYKSKSKSRNHNSELLMYKENCGYENNLYKSTESLHNCRQRGSYVNTDNILSLDYENPHRYLSATYYNINYNKIRIMHSTSQIDFNTNNKGVSRQINYNALKNVTVEGPNTESVNNDINGTVKLNAPNKDKVCTTRSNINQEGNITLQSEQAVEKKKNHGYKGVSEKSIIFLTSQGLATETYMVISKPVAIFLTNNILIEEAATIKPEGLFPSRPVTTSDVSSLSKRPFSKQTYREPRILRPARSRRDHFNNILLWSCYDCGLNATGFGTTICHAIFENDFDKKFDTRRRFRRTCKGDQRYHGQCFKRYLDIGTQYNERGCRDWPPVPGSSFASNGLMTLEYLLKDVANGCVASPQAALVRFSRSLRLYARFHVCVCSGELCNVAGTCQVDFLVGSLVLWSFLFR